MGLVRYALSIIVNLAMLLVGGFLLFAGGSSVLAVLFLQGQFNAIESQSGVSVGELWFADLTPWLITAGYLAVGLLLTILGARGLFRRIRRGLPDESEGLPRGGAGRLVQILLYGGGLLFGLAGIVVGLVELSGPATLHASGIRSTATIERTWSSVETEDRSDSGYFVAYSFTTESGERISAETDASAWFARTNEAGSEIEVIYDPADPSNNLLPAQYEAGDLIGFFGFRLFLVVVGLWGLRRAIRLSDLIAPPDPSLERRPVARQKTRSAAQAPKTDLWSTVAAAPEADLGPDPTAKLPKKGPASYTSARVERALRHTKPPRSYRRRPRVVN